METTAMVPRSNAPGTPQPPVRAGKDSTNSVLANGIAGLDSSYAVKVPVFEGPLDLLLHLIRCNEVEITDIPIARIAKQYLDYLKVLRTIDVDIAADYLVMAATLAWIKSRMLLPPDGVLDESDGPDPREELVARLLEYQRFKEVANELGERSMLGRDVFAATGSEPEPVPEADRQIEVGVFELVEAYRKVIRIVRHSGKAHEIEIERITVKECMVDIMERMHLHESIEFTQALLGPAGEPPTLPVLVSSFLAILELTRLDVIRLYQGTDEMGVPQGSVHLRRAAEPGDDTWTQRIADLM